MKVADFVNKYKNILIKSKNGMSLCNNSDECFTEELDFKSSLNYSVIDKQELSKNEIILVINFISDL